MCDNYFPNWVLLKTLITAGAKLSRFVGIVYVILLYEKFLQFDWLRTVVFQLNLKYLHVKITNL